MKDIPIIFSGSMIRALLDGRKTMTRRIIKAAMPPAPAMDAIHPKNVARHPAPYFDAYCGERKTDANPRGMSRNWCWWTRDDRQCLPTINVRFAPGDRLWVRESLKHIASDPVTAQDCSLHCYVASIPPGMDSANPYEDNYLLPEDGTPHLKPKSIPSIHMPRWASRLTLIVTGVKVERLQDISKADVMAEGIHERDGAPLADVYAGWHEPFAKLWTDLNGPDSWDANPFVVAISFEVVRANIDAPEVKVAA